MPEEKKVNPVKVRVFVRLSIPEMDVRGVPELQAAVQAIANLFQGAEIEVSMSQPREFPRG
jgi:hypothetical protein